MSGNNYAIITAGGRGTRMPGLRKKQFLRLGGLPIFLWPVLRFLQHPRVGRVIVVLPKDDYGLGRDILEEEMHNPAWADRLWFTFGGPTRQDSVYNGLCMCPADAQMVLVQDGVRPFVGDDDISRLLDVATREGAAIPVHPIKHTVKRVQGERILQTLLRDDLVEVSTPQVFRYALLKECHERMRAAGQSRTDDAALVEEAGHPVAAVSVSFPNIKITDSLDLLVAEHLLRTGEEASWKRSL